MGALVDDLRNALRRRLAVVRARNRTDCVWRSATRRRNWLGDSGRCDWYFDIYVGEASQPQKAAVPA